MPIQPAPTIPLAHGVRMPQLGLGTWPMNDAQAAVAVAQAIGLGYRLIDTAENYGNERGVGEGIRRSGVPRDEIFVTTKFNRQWHSVDGARQACDASLARLGLDHIDLLLVHWPNPDQNRYVEACQGLARLLGNCNAMQGDPVVAEVAARHGRTAAQVLLRWRVQQGFVTTPKSADATRQAQNLNIFDFTLSAEDMAALDGLDRPDPDMYDADNAGH